MYKKTLFEIHPAIKTLLRHYSHYTGKSQNYLIHKMIYDFFAHSEDFRAMPEYEAALQDFEFHMRNLLDAKLKGPQAFNPFRNDSLRPPVKKGDAIYLKPGEKLTRR